MIENENLLADEVRAWYVTDCDENSVYVCADGRGQISNEDEHRSFAVTPNNAYYLAKYLLEAADRALGIEDTTPTVCSANAWYLAPGGAENNTDGSRPINLNLHFHFHTEGAVSSDDEDYVEHRLTVAQAKHLIQQLQRAVNHAAIESGEPLEVSATGEELENLKAEWDKREAAIFAHSNGPLEYALTIGLDEPLTEMLAGYERRVNDLEDRLTLAAGLLESYRIRLDQITARLAEVEARPYPLAPWTSTPYPLPGTSRPWPWPIITYNSSCTSKSPNG